MNSYKSINNLLCHHGCITWHWQRTAQDRLTERRDAEAFTQPWNTMAVQWWWWWWLHEPTQCFYLFRPTTAHNIYSNVKFNKMQNVLSWFFWMIITCDCGLFVYFCEINKFLQSFLNTNLCLGFKCSKFTTSCVNVSSGPWANALCGDLGLLRMTYLTWYLWLSFSLD